MKNESRGLTWFSNIIMFLFAAACIIPFVLLISASLTDQSEIVAHGYSFIPRTISTAAYEYLYQTGSEIARAYGVTVFVTIVGTFLSLVMTTLMAYPLSRNVTPHRNLIMFFVFFTMLFSGGLVPSYLVFTQIFHLKNTIWALIVPMLMNGFNIMLMRTFFKSVPGALIESSELDGASEFRILWSVMLPLSTPILATIGLFQSIMYWNDWSLGMIYITDPKLFSIQNLLNRIMQDIQFITSNMSMNANAADAMAQMPSDSIKMAIAVIGVLPILLAYPFFQKYFIKGIMIGAVKG